jgi:aldose 1-epimerase
MNGPDGRSHVHGFAHDRAWRVVEEEGHHVTLELATLRDLTTVERNAYPFDIVLRQFVEVVNQALTISLVASNQGSEVAPVGLGLHPYIDPSFLNCARQDLVASLPGTVQRVLDGPIPTGGLEMVVSKTQALRDLEEPVICMTGLGRGASASLYGSDGLAVACDLVSGWNDFVLYAPDDQPSVALEPLTCSLSAASLNPASKISLPALPPNQSISAVLRLRLVT